MSLFDVMGSDKCLLSIAIVCITVLEAVALVTGFDGQAFSLVVGAICILAGVKLKELDVMNKIDNATSLKQLKSSIAYFKEGEK